MIALIPFSMEREWLAEFKECAEFHVEGEVPLEAPLPQRFKVAFCLAAMLISLLLLQLRGINVSTAVLTVYVQGVLLLAAINWRTSLLPDKLVQPLLWSGLLYHASHGNAVDQIYGATVGFAVPWVIY